MGKKGVKLFLTQKHRIEGAFSSNSPDSVEIGFLYSLSDAIERTSRRAKPAGEGPYRVAGWAALSRMNGQSSYRGVPTINGDRCACDEH
jgi:hypothetical protein